MRKPAFITAVLIILFATGCNPYQTGPSFEPSASPIMWDYGEKLAMGARFTASPTLIEDTIVVPSLDGNIYVFDAETGKKNFIPEPDRELYFDHQGRRVYMSSEGREAEPMQSLYKTTHGIRGTIAHRQGILYFGSFDKVLRGIDFETGHDRFAFETEDYISASPLIVDDVLYFGGYDTYFRAIDLTSSRQIWQVKTDGRIRGGAVATATGVVFGNDKGNVYHLDRHNGSVIWEFEGDDEIYANPAYIDGYVVCADLGGKVRVMNEQNGSIYWEFKTEPDGKPFEEAFWVSPAIDDIGVYIGSSWGKFYALKLHPDVSGTPEFLWGPFLTHNDADTTDSILAEALILTMEPEPEKSSGMIRFIQILHHPATTIVGFAISIPSGALYFNDLIFAFRESAPDVHETDDRIDKKILFGCNDGKMYCINGSTGNEIWSFKTYGEIRSKPVIYNNIVAFPSNDHYFYGLDLYTGQPVRGQIDADK